MHGLGGRYRRTTLPARHSWGRRSRCTPGPGGNRGVFTAWDVKKRAKAWELKEDLPVVERRARDRRRPGLLRHPRGLVQGGRRAHWRAANGSSKPAPGIIGQPVNLSRTRTAASTSLFFPAWAVGPGRSFPAGSTDAIHRRQGNGQRDHGPAAENHQGRNAVCLCVTPALALHRRALMALHCCRWGVPAGDAQICSSVKRKRAPMQVRTTDLQAGAATPLQPDARRAEYENNAYNLSEGKRLYTWFNCVGCHATAVAIPVRR